jgi:MerR family transcriptional regulator, copper efflux regulator
VSGGRRAAGWGTGAAERGPGLAERGTGATGRGTGAAGRGTGHRQFTESDLDAIRAGMELERRYDITPAALAFGLRVLTEPAVRAAVADLGRRTGHVPAGPGRALDFEKERALRALGAAARERP